MSVVLAVYKGLKYAIMCIVEIVWTVLSFEWFQED